MKLYLIRHGETDWNKMGRLQGRSDVPLNESGRTDAVRIGKALAEVPFDRIYSSPLKRAVETAHLIRGERDIPLVTDDRLMEMAFGSYEGNTFRDSKDPVMIEMMTRFFKAPETYCAPEGGEEFAQVCERTDEFLDFLGRTEKEDACVLIVGHGALLKALQLHPLGRSIAEFWGGGVQKNCAVSVLEEKGGRFTLLQDAEQMGAVR